MGRPPTHGAPSFRFHAAEVAQMESILREHAGNVPPREFLMSLANQFSNAPERAGKSIVQMKQVWNWFQNRRYALRSKLVKPLGVPNYPQVEVAPQTNVTPFPQQAAPMPSIPMGHNVVRNASESPPMEFEAKSSRDGAWYDVQQFLSQRYIDSSNPEVLVRFSGFGQEEDEWVDVHKRVRHRSLPCESSECTVVRPGDLILCFQEGKEQALYFDAHVLDAQRRKHDVRGCRCRFLVRYDHDQSEEIVPLRKLCRRPETDYRLQLQLLHSTNDSASASSSGQADSKKPAVDPASTSAFRDPNYSPLPSHTMVNPTAASGQVQAPAQAPFLPSGEAPAPSLTLISSPTPSQILTSDSALSATQIFSSTPVSVQSTISVRNPEVKKIESGSPTVSSAGEASARKTAGVIMEVKLEEIDSSRTSTEVAGGSSDPQGEASGNPSESTAPTEGGPSLSVVAERINVLSVSANDTKEGMQGVISID